MSVQHAPPSPDEYLAELFASEDAKAGGIVQITQLNMERFVGRDRFVQEITTRKFTAISNRENIVVFCNNHDVRLMA